MSSEPGPEASDDRPVRVPIYARPEITPAELGQLMRRIRLMEAALRRIETLAQAEIEAGVVTSKSRVPEILETAREWCSHEA